MSSDEEYLPPQKKTVSKQFTKGKTPSKRNKISAVYDPSLPSCSKDPDPIFSNESDQTYYPSIPSTSGCQEISTETTSLNALRFNEKFEKRGRKLAGSGKGDIADPKSHLTFQSPLLTEFRKRKRTDKEFYKSLRRKAKNMKALSDDKEKPNASGSKSYEVPFSKARDNLFKELFKGLDSDLAKDAEDFRKLSAGMKKTRGRPKKPKCDSFSISDECSPPNNWDFLNKPEVDAKLKKTKNKTVKKITTPKTEKGRAPAKNKAGTVVSESEKNMCFTRKREPEVAAKVKKAKKIPFKKIVASRTKKRRASSKNDAEAVVSETEKFICSTPNIEKKVVSRKSQKKSSDSSLSNELNLNFELLDLNLQFLQKETILLHPTDSLATSSSSEALTEFNSPASGNNLPVIPFYEPNSNRSITFQEECQTILSNFFSSAMNKSPDVEVWRCVPSNKSENTFIGNTAPPSKIKTAASAVKRMSNVAASSTSKSLDVEVLESDKSSNSSKEVFFIDVITPQKNIEAPVLPLEEESPSVICLLEADSVVPLVSEVKFHKSVPNGTVSPLISKSTGIEQTEFHLSKKKGFNIPLIDIATQPGKKKKDAVIAAERKRKFSALSSKKAVSSTLPVEYSQSVSDDIDISVMPKAKNIAMYSSEENYKISKGNQIKKSEFSSSTFLDNRVCRVLLQKLAIPIVLECSEITTSPNNKAQWESDYDKLSDIHLLPEEVVIGNKIPRVVLMLHGENTCKSEIL